MTPLQLIVGAAVTASTVRADAGRSCDIYASTGTPCVAAHSTVRALFAKYNGPLYQVVRSSDKTTKDIPLLTAGGIANSAEQDTFCASTDCTINRIYDQTTLANHLDTAPAGGAHRSPDRGCNVRGNCSVTHAGCVYLSCAENLACLIPLPTRHTIGFTPTLTPHPPTHAHPSRTHMCNTGHCREADGGWTPSLRCVL
jgi:hypothetical protein